jgi:hypothetical protein
VPVFARTWGFKSPLAHAPRPRTIRGSGEGPNIVFVTVKLFFDVDYTILSTDYGIRAGTVDTFRRLVADGHEVHLWSSAGERDKVVRDFALEPYVSCVYGKPLNDYVRRLDEFGIDCVPDFVVDDYPGIVSVFGGYHVPDFFTKLAPDDEMEQIYRTICDVAERGWSRHRRWRPRHSEFESIRDGRYRGRF